MKKSRQQTLRSILFIACIFGINASQTEVFANELSSATPPPVQTLPVSDIFRAPLDVSPMATNADVLLVQTALPWNSNANTDVLRDLGYSYIVTDFDNLRNHNINSFQVVLIVNDQVQAFYDSYAQNFSVFEEYVQAGGTLVFFACDRGWARGQNNSPLPGGIEIGSQYANFNYIENTNHPIVSGSLRTLDPRTALQDSDLDGNYCSHNYFPENTLLPGTDVILRCSITHEPTLIRYELGRGNVIGSGLTWEFTYDRYAGDFRRYGFGRALPDVFLYAFSIAGGLQTAEVVSVYVDDNRVEGRRPATLKMPGDILDIVAVVDFAQASDIEFDGTLELAFEIESELLKADAPIFLYRRASAAGIATEDKVEVIEKEVFTGENLTVIALSGLVPSEERAEYVLRVQLNTQPLSRNVDAVVSMTGDSFEYSERLSQRGQVYVSGFRKIILTNREGLYRQFVAPNGHLSADRMVDMDNLWRSLYREAERQNASLVFVDKWERGYAPDHATIIRDWPIARQNLPFDNDVLSGEEEVEINAAAESVAAFLSTKIEYSGGIGRGRYVAIIGDDAIIPFYRVYDDFGWDIALYTASMFPPSINTSGLYSSEIFRRDTENGYFHTDGRYLAPGAGSGWKSGSIDNIFLGRVIGASLNDIERFFTASTSTSVSSGEAVLLENWKRDGEMDAYQSQVQTAGFVIIDSIDGVNLNTAPPAELTWWEKLSGQESPESYNDDAAGNFQLFVNLFSNSTADGIGDFAMWRSMTHGSVFSLGASLPGTYFRGSDIARNRNAIREHFRTFRPTFIFDACLLGQVDGTRSGQMMNELASVGVGSIVAPSPVTWSRHPTSRTNFNNIISENLFLGQSVGQARQRAVANFQVPNTRLDDFTRLAVNVYGVPWRKIAPPPVAQAAMTADLWAHEIENRVWIRHEPIIHQMGGGYAPSVQRSPTTYGISFGPLTVVADTDQASGLDFLSVNGFEPHLGNENEPVLPYRIETVRLPRTSEVLNVTIEVEASVDLGTFNVPGFRRNLELPGISSLGEFVQLSEPSGIFPAGLIDYAVSPTENDLVVTILFYPVRYDTNSGAAILRESGEILVSFQTQVQGLTRVVEADAQTYNALSEIHVTALVENVSPDSAIFRHEVTVLDVSGNAVVDTEETSEEIPSGEHRDIWVNTRAPLAGGIYKLLSQVFDSNNELVSENERDIFVRTGELEAFVAPDRFIYGDSAFFSFEFDNLANEEVQLSFNVEIIDANGVIVTRLLEQTATITASERLIRQLPWVPSSQLAAGEYFARINMRDNAGTSYVTESNTFFVHGQLFAHAGPDQLTTAGSIITLDGSRSFSAAGNLSYSWALAEGPEGAVAELDDPESATPAVTIPVTWASENVDYIFTLTVSDGVNANVSDSVRVTAMPAEYSVTVTSTEGGFASISPLLTEYLVGSEVTITARPLPGYVFAGWGEDMDGAVNPLTITVNGDLLIKALFEPRPNIWSDARRHFRDWKTLGWLGLFNDEQFLSSGWIYHVEHGWQHYMGSDVGSLAFFDVGLGRWAWTSDSAYPWLYVFSDVDQWIYYLRGGEPGDRSFYLSEEDAWHHENDL
jgi:hypothetical protein